MSLPVPLHRYPYTEYEALEELSPVRHELVAGEIYAMAGGKVAQRGGAVELQALGARLSVDDVYRDSEAGAGSGIPDHG